MKNAKPQMKKYPNYVGKTTARLSAEEETEHQHLFPTRENGIRQTNEQLRRWRDFKKKRITLIDWRLCELPTLCFSESQILIEME